MSQQQPEDEPRREQGASRPAPENRLGPRPLRRPDVDPAQAALFGRPAGVPGAFAPPHTNGHRPDGAPRTAPPPAEALAEAFSRPPEQAGVVLQRPPGDQHAPGDRAAGADQLWSTGADDPWRDPAAGAMIGPPAVGQSAKREEADPVRGSGPRLSVPELLFGRRVKPTALALLAVVALVIGAVGGVVGWWVARQGNELTRDVTLAQVSPGVQRPAGSVSDIARRIAPAVVSIELRGANGGSVGSGAVIDGAGYVVTNNHVIADAAADPAIKVVAVFPDGSRAEARIVGRDPKTDLAVIKVQVTNPTVLQFGDSDALQVGDTVIAAGSPLGLSNTYTEGIVSALHRPRLIPGEGSEPPVAYDAIQTDASINRGNSGGPLVDATGALVGINSLIVAPTEDSGSIGLGFAIPSNYARKITQALIRDGQVKHAEIGINAVTDVSAGSSQGAKVANVADNGAAQKAGIREGDVITKVGDRMVRNSAELTVVVRANEVGARVPVVLVRESREMTVDVVLQSD